MSISKLTLYSLLLYISDLFFVIGSSIVCILSSTHILMCNINDGTYVYLICGICGNFLSLCLLTIFIFLCRISKLSASSHICILIIELILCISTFILVLLCFMFNDYNYENISLILALTFNCIRLIVLVTLLCFLRLKLSLYIHIYYINNTPSLDPSPLQTISPSL